MSKQTITEFLEARIAEDEAVLRWADDKGPAYSSLTYEMRSGYTFYGIDASRIAAECAAKRAIMYAHRPHDHGGTHGDAVFCDECQWDHGDDSPRIDNQPVEGFGANPCRTLAALAAVYADHPDYDAEWKP